MRVLLDTNVLVSALLEGTRLNSLRHAWKQGRLTLVGSDALLAELIKTMSYPKLGWNAVLAREVIATEVLPWFERVVPYAGELPAPCRDGADDMILRAALGGDVDALVTGDKDLLALRDRYPFPILTARSFLELLDTQTWTLGEAPGKPYGKKVRRSKRNG
jgi:uncharacterized protein